MLLVEKFTTLFTLVWEVCYSMIEIASPYFAANRRLLFRVYKEPKRAMNGGASVTARSRTNELCRIRHLVATHIAQRKLALPTPLGHR